jgi:hypothetical protein
MASVFASLRPIALVVAILAVAGLQPVVAQEATDTSPESEVSAPEPYVATPMLLPSAQDGYRRPASPDSSARVPMDTHVRTEEGVARAPEPYGAAPIALPSPVNGYRTVAPDSSARTPMDTNRSTEEGAPTPPEPYKAPPVEHPDPKGASASQANEAG